MYGEFMLNKAMNTNEGFAEFCLSFWNRDEKKVILINHGVTAREELENEILQPMKKACQVCCVKPFPSLEVVIRESEEGWKSVRLRMGAEDSDG